MYINYNMNEKCTYLVNSTAFVRKMVFLHRKTAPPKKKEKNICYSKLPRVRDKPSRSAVHIPGSNIGKLIQRRIREIRPIFAARPILSPRKVYAVNYANGWPQSDTRAKLTRAAISNRVVGGLLRLRPYRKWRWQSPFRSVINHTLDYPPPRRIHFDKDFSRP